MRPAVRNKQSSAYAALTWRVPAMVQVLIALLLYLPHGAASNHPLRADSRVMHDRSSAAYEKYEEVLEDRYDLAEIALSNYPRDIDAVPDSYYRKETLAGPEAGLPGAPAKPNIPEYELQALLDLYTATDGPSWRWFNHTFVNIPFKSGIPWNFTGKPYPCDPLWQGILCTPAPEDGYHHVIALDLQERNLRGEVPASFFNLTQLHGMSLATNVLYGTLPSTVSQLKLCKVVDFSNNFLTGGIPEELSQLDSMEALYFYDNNLNGTLPAALSDLRNLHVMKFTLNRLTGTIPAAYGNLSNLVLLYLGRNFLHGTIPPSLGYLSNVTAFYLYENYLSGTIPTSLVNLASVNGLDLDVNKLTGTIPDFIGNLSTVVLLYLNENKFTGTIPEALTRLTALQNMYLHDNLLTGTIPDALGSMKSVLSFELSYNKLHGTFPETFCTVPELAILLMTGNLLTGTIPACLGEILTLQTLELAANYFTGTIPPTLGALTNLTNLYLYANHLHGTIPPELGGMQTMVYLYLHENHFYGTLPHSLSNLTELNSLFLQDNILSGRLDGVVNGTQQKYLSLIQLSDNQLTGPLPESFFELRQLRTLVLVSNCFSGVVPPSICECSSLITLSLDGLRSASSCQQVMLPGISTAYVLSGKVRDGIPSCLFEMPNLNTLHLSGNGLTGSLPENVNISQKLIDLALSHNKLTGTIPRQYQSRIWYNLDLSYNKFGGTLASDFGTTGGNFTFMHTFTKIPRRNISRVLEFPAASLSLRNNRLSDRIPSTVLDMTNISVLAGNLFNCDLDERDLPSHDSGKATYQCGSTSFNISYYLWLASVLIAIVVVFLFYYWRQTLEIYFGGIFIAITYIKRWLRIVTWYDQENIRSKSRLHHYKYVMKVSEAICKVALCSTVFILVVTLPVYAVTSHYYGTHTFEYAWSASAAFLSGYDALSLLLVFFIVLLALLLLLFRYKFRELRRFLHELPEEFHFSVMEDFEEERAEEEESDSKYSSWYEKAAIYIAFFLINFTIVMGVNIAYVYVVIYEDSKYFTAAQIALSIFKLGWNNLGSLYLIRWTHHQIASSSTKEWKSKGAGFFAIQLFVALFNFIAIPCLVVAAVSPNCFNNLVVDAPTVTSHYYSEQCGIFSVHFGCLIYTPIIGTTSYNPPFTYSYECSSSLITYYSPSFVYLALIVTFVNPALEVLMLQAHRMRTKGTWLAGQLDYWVPLIVQDVIAEEDAERAPYDIFNPYFDANQLLVSTITYFGVLLTFGLVFPPLAVAMLVSIYVVVYSSKIEVGRFLTNAIDQNLHKYMDIVEAECHGVGSIPKLRQCVAMLIVFACLFYTPFLFDTLGDSVGVSGAAWVTVVVPLFPPAIYLGHMTYIVLTRKRAANSRERQSSSIQLRKSEFFRSKAAAAQLDTAIKAETEMARMSVVNPVNANETDSEDGGSCTINALQKQV